MDIINSLVKLPPEEGSSSKSNPNGVPDVNFLKFFYPNFKIISSVEYFSNYEGIIYIVDSKNMAYANNIKDMGIPYILVSNSCEYDLSNRDILLEFVFSHHNKSVPKYVLEMKDALDNRTFYSLVKNYWVTGSWSLKEYDSVSAFIEFINSFSGHRRVQFIKDLLGLIDICSVNKLEQMFLSFLQKVQNNDAVLTGSYGKAVLAFRKSRHMSIEDAVLKNITSPIDNQYLRLYNFIISLKY